MIGNIYTIGGLETACLFFITGDYL